MIRMYFGDHPPPHFHARYGGSEAVVGIEPIRVLRGDLPRRAASMVVEWAALHQGELRNNWRHVSQSQSPTRIEPLT
ncbi:MAG: DUF4160 domain-containing protein [Planctomycetota bacterium]